MNRLRYILVLLLAISLWQSMAAQEKSEAPIRPVFTAVEFEIGGSRLIDTYLSPWCYRGWDIAVGVELMKSTSIAYYDWVWQQQIRANYGSSRLDISRNGRCDFFGFNYDFALMRCQSTGIEKLRLYYGGDIALTGEGVYNYHGGNNPISVKADISLGLTGMAVYDFRLGKLPFTARYQLSIPVIGVFAQPEYAESYYEVGLGNHKNFIHFGAWNNKFDMTNRVTVDMHFGSWALRIGYHNIIYTTYINDNRYQLVSHNFIIGFAGDLISWSKKNQNRPVQRALYAY